MLTVKQLRENAKIIHTRTGEEYTIVDSDVQMKLEDSKWTPAVSYRKANEESWRAQLFIRDMRTFMENFSVKPEEE